MSKEKEQQEIDEQKRVEKIRTECLDKLLGERLGGDISEEEMTNLVNRARQMAEFIING